MRVLPKSDKFVTEPPKTENSAILVPFSETREMLGCSGGLFGITQTL
jgi:hypothetical protein